MSSKSILVYKENLVLLLILFLELIHPILEKKKKLLGSPPIIIRLKVEMYEEKKRLSPFNEEI
jgi:hypothetical protein